MTGKKDDSESFKEVHLQPWGKAIEQTDRDYCEDNFNEIRRNVIWKTMMAIPSGGLGSILLFFIEYSTARWVLFHIIYIFGGGFVLGVLIDFLISNHIAYLIGYIIVLLSLVPLWGRHKAGIKSDKLSDQ